MIVEICESTYLQPVTINSKGRAILMNAGIPDKCIYSAQLALVLPNIVFDRDDCRFISFLEGYKVILLGEALWAVHTSRLNYFPDFESHILHEESHSSDCGY